MAWVKLTVSAIFQKVIILLAMINMISFSKVFEYLSEKRKKWHNFEKFAFKFNKVSVFSNLLREF